MQSMAITGDRITIVLVHLVQPKPSAAKGQLMSLICAICGVSFHARMGVRLVVAARAGRRFGAMLDPYCIRGVDHTADTRPRFPRRQDGRMPLWSLQGRSALACA